MKVRDLIKELKNVPQNLNVFYSNHDNSEWEIAGDITSVSEINKDDYLEKLPSMPGFAQNEFNSNPKKWIILRP